MKKGRSTRKPKASPSRWPSPSPSPLPETNSPVARDTPKSTIINKKRRTVGYSSASLFSELQPSPKIRGGEDSGKTLATISDLKEFASSRLDDIRRNLVDRSHSEILKDLEASHSRLHKRFKIQNQACQQITDEAEREFKRITEWITKNHEAIKTSYMELAEEAQATASRVCKTSMDELSKSFNRKLDDIRNRFRISAT